MPPTSSTILERLLAAYQRDERLVLVFDYDGTLTPLVAHPRLAHLNPALRDVLARLATTPRVTVGVVSGRGLDDLIGMVGLEGLSYGGSTGLELELAGERRIPTEALESRALLDALRAASKIRLAAYPGAWVENKPFGFTVHYRQLAPNRIDPLRAEIADLLEPHAAGLHVLDGPLAIEVVPAIERDKGTALRAIVAACGEPATVLYAGDAANDALALAAAAERGGVALGIGPEPPAEAAYRLPDPAALTELLAALSEILTTAGSPAHPNP
ncbi:MAG: trehalose-phosphatase [Candidatus Contendobacter sp.]|nr:trehalose-phosphatase [Candidatus Contendobacter sp.]MDG4556973.1 trehalose-phosphatase [Candidatus Contendobacter sp.]